jgi:hypothetical protein
MSQLACINYITEIYSDVHVVVGGDLNVDFHHNSVHCQILKDYLIRHGLTPCHQLENNNVNYSCNFDNRKFNILDHLLLSAEVAAQHDIHCVVQYNVKNISYHEPIPISLKPDVARLSANPVKHFLQWAWYKCSDSSPVDYKMKLY